MKLYHTILLLSVITCNINISMCQSLSIDKENSYRSLINHINDTSFEGCACLFDVRNYSSFLPNQRYGIVYALAVERKIDSSFSECSTISKNDSLFHYINAKDMERIKSLYEEWFMVWKKDTSFNKRALDGTEYKWVNLKGAWFIGTTYW